MAPWTRPLGPCARALEHIDRFAAAHNATAPRLNSRFAIAGTEAVDAFTQSVIEGLSFVLHFGKISAALDRIEHDDAKAVVVVPEWTRKAIWQRLHSGTWA